MSSKILSNDDQTHLSAEDLPNELYLDIFNYLLPEELFKAFGNLNLRFSILLRSAFIHFQVTENNVTLFPVIKANQIKSIMINDIINFPIVEHYFKKNHLIQLQRLDLTFTKLISVRTFIEYLPQFDNLKFLHLNKESTENCEEARALYQFIAELPFTPPFSTRLQKIELFLFNTVPYYGYMLKPNPLPILKYFSLISICLDDLAIILTWMPAIKVVKILYAHIINDDDVRFHVNDLTSRSLIQMPAITSLRQLDIGICDGVTCKVNHRV